MRGVRGRGCRLAGCPLPPLAGRQVAAHAPCLVAKAARQAGAACRERAGRPGGHRRSVSAAADPMQIQRGKKVIAPCQILEKKKEKRKNPKL